jgi:hypothetical protein
MYVGDFPLTALSGSAVLEARHAWPEIAGRCAGNSGGDLPRALPDLADLSYDSSLEPVRGLRGDPGQARVLIFTATPLSLELEVMADHVAGQIVPPGPGEILVETPDGTSFRIEADDIGFFDFAGLPRGRIRLRCETPSGRLVTDWVCL